MDKPTTSHRQRVWVTTAEACSALGMSRETLRQLRLRGVLTPGKHYRRWDCTQSRPPAVAPGERGDHDHRLESAAPVEISGRNGRAAHLGRHGHLRQRPHYLDPLADAAVAAIISIMVPVAFLLGAHRRRSPRIH
jgi:hypothetical protein